MKSGGCVLGFYGAKSFAAYAKGGPDVYLERVYVEDEDQRGFGPEALGNHGVWLRADEVVSLEFYDPDYDVIEETTQDGDSAGGASDGEAGQQAGRSSGP